MTRNADYHGVTTVVRLRFRRGTCASHLSATAMEGRAYARGWRTCVPSEPRTDGRGHLFVARSPRATARHQNWRAGLVCGPARFLW